MRLPSGPERDGIVASCRGEEARPRDGGTLVQTRSACEQRVTRDSHQLCLLANTPHSEFSRLPVPVPEPERGWGEMELPRVGREGELRSQDKQDAQFRAKRNEIGPETEEVGGSQG